MKKQQNNGDSTDVSPIGTPDTSRPSTPAAHLLAGKSGPKGGSRRARKAVTTPANVSSGDERKAKPKKDSGKKMRKWDADGLADEEDGAALDYSAQSPQENGAAKSEYFAGVDSIDSQSFGTRTGKGQFVLKDLDSEVHSILEGASEKRAQPSQSKSGVVSSSLGAISGLFRNVIGGKVLTKEDLAKPMRGMEEHLLNKNVAREAAVRLCEGVERELIGVKTGSFESTSSLHSSSARRTLIRADRRRNNNSFRNGILSPQNSYPHNVPRHFTLHIIRYQSFTVEPPITQTTSLCYLYRRRQRRRQIH